MQRLIFSGHETFTCKQFWLKKGYDFGNSHNNFNDESAVVHLGVGKNMVTSIRYWLKAFNLLNDDDKTTEIASSIFGNNGWDPFLEDEGTLWLLHYLLIKSNRASIYNIIFNDLRKQKPEFTRIHLFKTVSQIDGKLNERTIKDDFSVFIKTYINDKEDDVEDGFSGLLADLNLLTELKENKEKGVSYFAIENKERAEIPLHILLYAILDNTNYGDSINFDNLYSDRDSIGSIFALNRDGLIEHLVKIAMKYPKYIVFKNDPLARELQFKGKRPNGNSILKDYYGN
jgi:Protein of unknown function (DUF4007)